MTDEKERLVKRLQELWEKLGGGVRDPEYRRIYEDELQEVKRRLTKIYGVNP